MRLQFIEAGQIVTTHGVRGEVKVLPWLDSPEMLKSFRRCRIEGKDYALQSVRVQKGCDLVKLSGIDTMDSAQALRRKTMLLYREDAPKDLIFASELIGVEVFAEEECLGKITDVLDYPGNMVYVVEGAYRYMIPAVKAYVLRTDLEENRMEIKLIEGMRCDED